jgi:hypothetical protein
MISEAPKNKAQGVAETKAVAPVKAVAVSAINTEFFYPPNAGYAAIAVIAASREDADVTYLAIRKKVIQEEAQPEVAGQAPSEEAPKVEETKVETE